MRARDEDGQALLLALGFMVFLVGAARVLAPFALGEGARVVRDVGLSAVSLCGMFLIVMVGTALLQREVERRSIYVLLSKPLSRSEYLLGKYLGLVAMLAVCVTLMTATVWLVDRWILGRFHPVILLCGLGTLAELAPRHGFDVTGAYDRTQMEEVQTQWAEQPRNRWKTGAWTVIAERLSGKRSTPYREGAVHDYMHAKAIVADGTVLAGSYNLSKHGVMNAENLVVVRGGRISSRVLEFAARVAARYASASVAAP